MRRSLVRVAAILPAIVLLLAPAARGQEPYVIQGSVIDAESGRPMPAVAVQIRGTNFGAITNQDGLYTIRAQIAPGSYTLEYSFIGRNTTTRPVTLGADRSVSVEQIAMRESALPMEAIAVTIAGIETERAKLPNSVAVVAGEDVNNAPGAVAIDQALQGKIAGAVILETNGQPGGGVSIRLRGASSVLGGAEPLIVVDGIIVDNSSEALIGLSANASGGGRGNSSLTNRLGDLSANDIDRIEVLKGSTATALYGSRANNGVIQIFTKQGQQGAPRITFTTSVQANQNPEQYELLMEPVATRNDAAVGLGTIGEPVQRFDIQDQVFRTGYGTSNSLSLSGGNEQTSYYFSGNYIKEEGTLESTDYEKKDVRLNLTHQVSDRLAVTGRANYIDTETNLIPEGEQTQGVLTYITFTPTAFNPAFNPELGRFPHTPLGLANPLDVIANWRTSEDVKRFIGNVEAQYDLLDNLRLGYMLGIDDYDLKNTYLQPPFSLTPAFGGSIQTPTRFSRQITSLATANHVAEIGDGLELASLGGFRYTRDSGETIRATAQDLPPGQETVTGATQFASQALAVVERAEFFLQEQLSFGDRLTLTGAINYEGASPFGEDERWQLYPKIGAAWRLDQEPWWEGGFLAGAFDQLKLRAAYGESGGQPPGAYEVFNNFVSLNFAGKPGRVPSTQLGNATLKPEREREIEAGVEASLLEQRIGVDFTVYWDWTEDLILSVPLPTSRGVSSQFQNIGKLENRGWELSLTTVNFDREDLSWRSRLSLGGNENEVTELVTEADSLLFGYLNWVIEGQPLGVFYGWFYDRNEDGTLRLTNGVPRRARNEAGVAARRILGDPNPDLVASFGNTVNLGRSLEFYLLLDGRFGNEVANFSRRIMGFLGSDPILIEEIRGEKPVGYYARNAERFNAYEEYIEPGWYVKLREVAATWQLDPAWVQAFGASGMSLRLAGRNLYTWTDYTGLDPEINLFAANTVAIGVDFSNVPLPRTYSASVTFNF
jgi:TonB-linked SusC/RagA family outer membrane protein